MTSAATCAECGEPFAYGEKIMPSNVIAGRPHVHEECAGPSAASAHDLAAMTEAEFWPLVEQAKERVLTNDLDALEALVVDGLPPKEMQAAAWALVQRVRGLKDDLGRLERARAAWQREAQK